ncbi:trimeric intracellular cation channel family protein, partial [Glaesserella parasuis]
MNELFPPFPWSFLFIQDLIGTIVFAISGAIAARQHKMDIFGMFVLAFVTGVGGGTLR